MTRIVIADDHAMFRQGLARLLSSVQGFAVIAETGNGHEALSLILGKQPELAVVDISMPGLSGTEILKEVRRKEVKTRIVLLTMHTDPELAAEAVKYGVSGYLLKENAFEDLLSAFQLILEGKTFISPDVDNALSCRKSETVREPEKLTRREKEILGCVALGLISKEIADRLNISVKTVETHRANIIAKLNLHSTAELVKYAIHKGIAKT
jgi:DNA-binding NarL/FixJ family response regulator